jgi:hypothetical protein
MSAVEASFKAPASAIIVLTTSGNTARLVSKYRPRCPILAVTGMLCDAMSAWYRTRRCAALPGKALLGGLLPRFYPSLHAQSIA